MMEWASEVVGLAREGLTRLGSSSGKGTPSETEYLEPLARMVTRGETPADVLVAGLGTNRDLAPQVMELAKL